MPPWPRPTRKLAAAALCAVALVAAGCGGTSSYTDDLKGAEDQFRQSERSSVRKIQSATTKREYAAGVNEFKSAIQTFEGKLRTLKPPSRARSAQAALVTALDDLSQDLDAVLRAVNSGDIARVQPLQTKIPRDARAVEAAGKELHKQAE